jgi:FixJ family two-component response regulator
MSSDALIAIVENDAACRRSLTRLLKASGFEVAPFASGEEFLAGSEGVRVDCILIDVHLGPGLGGFDLARELAKRDRRTPFVLMTASLDPSYAQRAADLGSRHFLHKPFDAEELLAALRYALIVPG